MAKSKSILKKSQQKSTNVYKMPLINWAKFLTLDLLLFIKGEEGMFCIINDKIYGGNKGSFDPFWRFIAQNGCKLRNDSLLPFSYISAGFIERDTHISYCLLYILYILLQCLLGHFTPKMCSIKGFQSLSCYQNCEPISWDWKNFKKI